MKLNGVEFDFCVDYKERKVHLLEQKNGVYNNLANQFDKTFQSEFIRQENLLMDVIDFEWVLYCLNGLILSYKRYNLGLVLDKKDGLYKPFLDVLEGK